MEVIGVTACFNSSMERVILRVTPLRFIGRIFFERKGRFPLIIRSDKLFDQFLCDMWCKMESDMLSYTTSR